MKKAVNKKSTPKSTHPVKEKHPEYMVHIADPKMLRKDLLESLREIIIFMQGYEKFRQIQEEKVAHFSSLKARSRDLNNLVDNKLKHYFPKGKAGPVKVKTEAPPVEEPELPAGREPMVVTGPRELPRRSDLDELESQLKDIESQLKRV